MEINRLIAALVFPIFLLAMPVCVFADDMKDIREMRESLIRIEERMVTKDELKTEITAVRNELRAEIKDVRDEIKEFMLWGFGVTFTGIFALIGFVLWDRRTALSPAIRKSCELEEREEKIEKALKEIALKDSNVRDALRHVGILTE